jgi:hypothetical protein
MNKKTRLISAILLTIFIFFIYSVSSVRLYARLFLPVNEWIGTLILTSITVYFLMVLLEIIVSKQVRKFNIILFYLLYSGFTLYTLLAPYRGMYGLNLNPFNIFETQQDIIIVLLNLLLFTPIGFLLKLNWKNLIIMALFIASIESMQYLLHIGFADINDWLSNMISFIIGTQLIKKFNQVKII